MFFSCKNSGDQDSVIPLTGSRTLVSRLAKRLGLRTSVPYRVWFAGQQVKNKHHSLMVKEKNKTKTLCLLFQVGGWTQVYGNVLSFATVRGAAHEVPFSQPERSLVLFKAFLDGHPLPEEF